jgi:TRAP-type C4-dicarboxylate transport system permease small subunit
MNPEIECPLSSNISILRMRKMMKVSRVVEICENYCLSWAILGSVVISIVGVFCRYCLHFSLSWVEEIAGYLLLTAITVGIGPAVRAGSHLRVDMLPQLIPRTKKSLDIIASTITLGVLIILLMLSLEFVAGYLKSDRRLTSVYWLREGFLLIVMPLGYLIAVYRLVENVVKMFKPATKLSRKSE